MLKLSFLLLGERRSFPTGDRFRASFKRFFGVKDLFRGLTDLFFGVKDLLRTGEGLVIGGDFKGDLLSRFSCLVDVRDGGLTGDGVFLRFFLRGDFSNDELRPLIGDFGSDDSGDFLFFLFGSEESRERDRESREIFLGAESLETLRDLNGESREILRDRDVESREILRVGFRIGDCERLRRLDFLTGVGDLFRLLFFLTGESDLSRRPFLIGEIERSLRFDFRTGE